MQYPALCNILLANICKHTKREEKSGSGGNQTLGATACFIISGIKMNTITPNFSLMFIRVHAYFGSPNEKINLEESFLIFV